MAFFRTLCLPICIKVNYKKCHTYTHTHGIIFFKKQFSCFIGKQSITDIKTNDKFLIKTFHELYVHITLQTETGMITLLTTINGDWK